MRNSELLQVKQYGDITAGLRKKRLKTDTDSIRDGYELVHLLKYCT